MANDREAPFGLFAQPKNGSEKARDAVLESLKQSNADWVDRAMRLLGYLRRTHAQVTGEQLQDWLRAEGLEAPASPNAWGALVNLAVRRGVLSDSGRVERMTKPGSHARRTTVWLVT